MPTHHLYKKYIQYKLQQYKEVQHTLLNLWETYGNSQLY